MEYTDTEPLREFARRRGFSPTTVYGWADDRLIKTFLIGGRRHVVLSFYGELVERLIAEQGGAKRGSPNPRAGSRPAEPQTAVPRRGAAVAKAGRCGARSGASASSVR
jgi:hypothetical protein